jgi:RNA polymerase sigma factor (sigma-70 family)
LPDLGKIGHASWQEQELWSAFKQGDEQAFSEIYQRFVEVLYNYGYHIVADTFLVQDAIQDLFADLWRMRRNLANTTSIKFYLFRSLRRRLHRLSGGQPGAAPASLLLQTLQTDSVETLKIRLEDDALQLQKLQRAIMQLPSRQQEVIRLRFYDGFRWEEIAGILQINEQSVRNLVQRSILKLRGMVSRG